ncbi:MAG: hypothetical protein M3Z26_00260 [Bacteroidota bacterium]|nr:hypothetical protein [Bacteroidota bacterium]
MYDNSKETEATKKEIEIRGRYLMMACDIEFSLFCIIMYSSPDPHNHARTGNFRKMRMANKIECAIKDLKTHKPLYYDEYEEDLNKLKVFNTIRNDMAHHKGSFNKVDDLSIFTITYIEELNGIEGFLYKDYTEKYILESVELFSILNSNLHILSEQLKKDLDLNDALSDSVQPNNPYS